MTHPASGKSFERQMRNWELGRAQRKSADPSQRVGEPFVCVSRTVASGGAEIATRLGERLGWPVFDRELLQAMSGDDRLRARLYEQMDEHETGWLDDAVSWVVGQIPRHDYFYRLTEAVLAIHRQSRAVFLGRAADLILPRDCGVRVRITASLERRARTYAERLDISEALARAEIERLDRERDEFRRQHFGKTATELTRYDLLVTMDRVTTEAAVELITALLRLRGDIDT